MSSSFSEKRSPSATLLHLLRATTTVFSPIVTALVQTAKNF